MPRCGPPSGLYEKTGGWTSAADAGISPCRRKATHLLEVSGRTVDSGWYLCDEHTVLVALWVDDQPWSAGATVTRKKIS